MIALKSIRPLSWICFGYIGGIVLSRYWEMPLMTTAVMIIFLLGVFLKARRPMAVITVLILLSGLFGFLRMHVKDYNPRHDIRRFYDMMPHGDVRIKGVVVSDVTAKTVFRTIRYSFSLDVKSVELDGHWQKSSGKVLVQMYRDADVHYSDQLVIKGKLHPPFEYGDNAFSSYVDYLANHGIHLIVSVKKEYPVENVGRVPGLGLRRWASFWRNDLAGIFDQHLTVNEAGIMKAVILGDRSGMPAHVKELFVRTGTAHVLAMSGLHVGIVAGIFSVFIQMLRLPYRYRYFFIIITLSGFSLLTGLRPSIIRALIMACIIFGGYVFERPSERWNNVFVAAFCILLYNPLYIFDVGFQLSFSCILSIFAAIEWFAHKQAYYQLSWLNKLKVFIIDSMAVSLAIWIGVSGLMAMYFNVITPVSILVNLWVIPLTSVIVVLGFGLIMSQWLIPFFAIHFAYCIKLALNFMVATLFCAEKIPWGHFSVKIVSIWEIIAYYVIVFFLITGTRLIIKRQQSRGISLTKP